MICGFFTLHAQQLPLLCVSVVRSGHMPRLFLCVLQELEKHTGSFVEQARVLATWDSAVLSNRHALLDLEAELRAVHAGQEALDRQLGMIETHQKVCRQPHVVRRLA